MRQRDVAAVDAEVDMRCAPPIPPRPYGVETCDARVIGGLHAAQPVRGLDRGAAGGQMGGGREERASGPAGVLAHCIGVPDINKDIGDGRAVFGVQDRDFKG